MSENDEVLEQGIREVERSDMANAAGAGSAANWEKTRDNPPVFQAMTTHDIRFPTSQDLDGSDAMNQAPDYSAAYVVVETDADDGLAGHGFVFTTGRGNEVELQAIRTIEPMLVGLDVESTLDDLGGVSRWLVYDSQLRWLGPEKGVMHMAIGAVVNALWDLKAKREGQPLWRLLARMSPDQLVDLVDFRYLTDALTPAEARDLLTRAQGQRAERELEMREQGYPAYTTTPGWLGYDDAKLAKLSTEAVEAGFDQIKLKVGGNVDDDIRRLRIARDAVGDQVRIAVDANQTWDVPVAIDWIQQLALYEPHWIEEPTSPDDILGHAAIRRAVDPIRIATGEHAQNRVLVKQLLQAEAVDVIQLDAARVGGVNENIAILLLCAKFGVPVCPHAGGVGLCELVQHLAMFDFVAVSQTWQHRMIEYVDHLHEHFQEPVRVLNGRYQTPTEPGFSAQMYPESLRRYTFPDGPIWSDGQVADGQAADGQADNAATPAPGMPGGVQ